MWSRARAVWVLQLLVLFWSGWSIAAEDQEFWYSAALNHVDANLTVRLVQHNGQLYVRHIDLVMLELKLPETGLQNLHGEGFYAAHSLPDHQVSIDHLQKRAYFFDRQRPHLPAPPSEDLLLAVTANGRLLDQPQYLRYQNGELLVPEATMQALGVIPAKIWNPRLHGAMPLHALAGEHYALDYSHLSLDTRLLPELLQKLHVNVTEQRISSTDLAYDVPVSHQLTAMLNYDLLAGYTESTIGERTEADRNRWHSGLFELAVGRGNSQCRADYFNSDQGRWRRLNAYCQQDWPEHRLTAVVGETHGTMGVLTRPLRYGGVRVGSDFSLQPERLTIPFQSIEGIVDQPATLELWIDRALALRTDMPAGPFELGEIPLRLGAGELHAYVTPLFGEQQYFNYSFYVDPALLKPGLSEWALEAGRLRETRSGAEDEYTDAFVAGTLRRGITRRLTLGMGAQGSEALQVASLGAAFTLGNWAALDGAVAASRGAGTISDPAWQVRVSHQGDWFNASWRLEKKPANYRELAWRDSTRIPETRRQISLGMPLPYGMSILLQETYRRYHDGTDFGFRTAGFTMPLGRRVSLRVTASRTLGEDAETFYGAHISIPLGRRESASLSGRKEGDNQWAEFSFQRSLPAGPGFGYRVNLADTPTGSRAEVDVQAQNALGRLSIQGSQFHEGRYGSVRASGSVLLSGSGLSLSRRAQGSYALVNVGVADIPVFHSGQLKAYTNADGEALIPGLRPFEPNTVHIRAEDIPVDVRPRSLKATVAPGRRELVRVDFGLQRQRYYTGRLVNAEGDAIAAGSRIYLTDQEDTLVGQGGEFFIASSSASFEFEVMLPGGSCRIRINAEAEDNGDQDGLVTDLGEQLCEAQTDSATHY